MKAPKLISFSTLFLVALSLSSCESHEQKPDDAFESAKSALGNPLDSNAIIEENSISKKIKSAQAPKTIVAKSSLLVERNASANEWTIYRNKTEKQIHANENAINSIRDKANVSSKHKRMVKRYEAKNSELKQKLNGFAEEQKLQLEEFKSQLSSDVNKIDSDLKAIEVSNK